MISFIVKWNTNFFSQFSASRKMFQLLIQIEVKLNVWRVLQVKKFIKKTTKGLEFFKL